MQERINNPVQIRKWVNDFQIAGPDALRPKKKGQKKSVYSKENVKTVVRSVDETPADNRVQVL